MLDLINEILATLRHNKLRTALTGFAVSWGIFLLIVLLSVSQGLINGMEAMFSERDFESMTISGGWAHKPFDGLSEDRPIKLRDRDLTILASKNGNVVASVAANINSDSTIVSTQKDYLTDGYTGVYPSGLHAEGGKLKRGRFINDSDIREKRRVIVLHEKNADILFGEHVNPIGCQVKVGELSFLVVGTYAHEWNKRSFIPYSTARSMSGGSDKVNRITVGVKNLTTIADGERAEKSFRQTLGREHRFDPSDNSAVWIWNRFNNHLTTSSAMNALQFAVWVIGLLTMLSGIVGVSNIMFVSVRERTHEIGVKRAIGARPFAILKQIILESIAITTLFGYIGIILGLLVAQFLNTMAEEGDWAFMKNPSVNIAIALQVTVVLIVAGALAGLFPAIKSLKIKPVEALRDE